MKTSDIADTVRSAITDTLATVAEVLKNAPTSLTANEAGEMFSDPANVSELQGALVARFDQFVAEHDA